MDLLVNQCDDEDDQLNGIAKRHIQQRAECVTHSSSHALGGMGKESRERHNGNGIHSENDAGIKVANMNGEPDWYKDQKDVDPAVEQGILRVHTKALDDGRASLG